jgi:hypothetical protein
VARRTLLALVATVPRSQKVHEFETSMGVTLGMAEIDVDKLGRKQLVAGWYKLFDAALYHADTDSN